MELTITKPDDFHHHFRDYDYLSRTVADCAQRFARAVAMPNLKPPVIDVASANAYRQRILQHIPAKHSFTPLMSLYLTDSTTTDMVREAAESDHVIGFKLYPAGATTHSASGVTDIKKIYPIFEAMQQHNVVLQIHGEVTDESIDVFDREKQFIDTILNPIIKQFPKLNIVLEHITTKDAVDFILQSSNSVAATITAHHLLLNRNHLLSKGIRPHYFCLPILKRNQHQQALISAAISGNKKFFLGTDSAPHTQSQKESACGCAGIYTAHAAIELYAEVFEQAKALDKLEAFASFYGADFYQLPRNKQTITLKKHTWTVAKTLPFGKENLVPLKSNETIHWQLMNT